MAWGDRWTDIDVVVVDAADEGAMGDHFPGVGVVKAIRANQGDKLPVVVVVTGHYLSDGLRHRMAGAGADFFFFRGNLRLDSAIVDIVCHPENYRRGVPSVADKDRRRLMGITPHTDVEAIVDYVVDPELRDAFDSENPQRNEPRSRKWLRHRKAIAKAAGVEPVNIGTGEKRMGKNDCPSLRQLSVIYAWLAKTKPVDDGTNFDR